MIDWKEVIVIKIYGDKGKWVIPKSAILGLDVHSKSSWATGSKQDEQIVRVLLDVEFVKLQTEGLSDGLKVNQKGCWVDTQEELQIILGILQGSKAASVLFGENK